MNKQLKDFCEYIISMMEALPPEDWTASEYNFYEYAISLMEQYGDKQTTNDTQGN